MNENIFVGAIYTICGLIIVLFADAEMGIFDSLPRWLRIIARIVVSVLWMPAAFLGLLVFAIYLVKEYMFS